MTAAKADYETAISLDEALAEAYLGLANVYMLQGDQDRALEILRQGLEKTGNSDAIADRLEELEAGGGAEEGKFNAFGVKAFTRRYEYLPYDQMTALEQELVQAMTNAAIDRAAESPEEVSFYNGRSTTMWNGYKIQLVLSNRTESGGSGNWMRSANAEIRPENGTGYVCFVNHSTATDTAGKESWSDYDSTTQAVCPCAGWQWNGTMRLIIGFNFFWHSANGGYSRTISHYEETGTMDDSLRNGTFTRNSHIEEESLYAAQQGEPRFDVRDNVYTEVYQTGIRVDQADDPPALYGLTGGAANGMGGSLSNPQFLEEYYW